MFEKLLSSMFKLWQGRGDYKNPLIKKYGELPRYILEKYENRYKNSWLLLLIFPVVWAELYKKNYQNIQKEGDYRLLEDNKNLEEREERREVIKKEKLKKI